MSVRAPVCAGTFYPADADHLRTAVRELLAGTALGPPASAQPRALVVPHAGYRYSGAVAAAAFAALARSGERFTRAVVLGPSHFVAFSGLALPRAPWRAFATPLGELALDLAGCATAADLPQVVRADGPHGREHALEVELPFLQVVLPAFGLVPLVAGTAAPSVVAEVLERLADPGTLVVLSTDLSHFHSYPEAQQRDQRTAAAIEALDHAGIAPDDACGHVPLRGLLLWAQRRGLTCTRLVLGNSGDRGGGHDSVVGYGAFALA